MRIFYIIFLIFLFLSCSENPKDLENSGNYDQALALYKEMLAEDYKNEDLRIKFTLCYFKNAGKHISEGDLDEAERNIERGIIYTDITHTSIKDEYSDIILMLGEELIKIGDPDGTVYQKKKYKKGFDLIKKSVEITEDNTVGINILNRLNKTQGQKYFLNAKDLFFQWNEDTKNKNLLLTSLDEVENSLEMDSLNREAIKLKNNILENLLFESINDNDQRFRIMRIFHNTATGNTAFKIRFYNDSDHSITVSPDQFTLTDIKGNYFKYNINAGKKGNYIGLLSRKKITPGRFINGLIVFDTAMKNPVFSSLSWRSGNDYYKKYFPDKKILELIKTEK